MENLFMLHSFMLHYEKAFKLERVTTTLQKNNNYIT